MLIEFTRWLEHSGLGQGIHNSSWLFPFIEVFHLIAIGILGGAVLLVDLRLFGWGLRRHPAAELARDVQPVLNIGLAVLLISGFFCMLRKARRCTSTRHFASRWRVSSLPFFKRSLGSARSRRTRAQASHRLERGWGRALSLMLWVSVGLGGRAIGFI